MFEETEGKSIVTLVPAIFTERNTERKRKRCGKRGAMRKREKKGDCREKYMLVNKERLVSAKQYPTFCLLNKSKIYTVGIDEMRGDLHPSFVCPKRKRTRSSKKEKQNSLIVMTLSEVFELHSLR